MYISLAIHDFQFSVLTTQHEKYYSGGNSSPCSLAGFSSSFLFALLWLSFRVKFWPCIFIDQQIKRQPLKL